MHYERTVIPHRRHRHTLMMCSYSSRSWLVGPVNAPSRPRCPPTYPTRGPPPQEPAGIPRSIPSIQPACQLPCSSSRPSSSGLLFGNHSVSVCLISHSIPSLAPSRTLVKLSRPIAPPWPCRPSNTPRHLLPASPRAAASVKDALAQTNKTRHGGNQARCTETGHRGRTRAAHARGLAAAPEQGVYALLNIQRRRTDARRGPLCPAKVLAVAPGREQNRKRWIQRRLFGSIAVA